MNAQNKNKPSNEKQLVNAILNNLDNPNWNDLFKDQGYIDNYAKIIQRNLKTSQLRRFFDEFKKIKKLIEKKQKGWEIRLWTLVPAIKYAKGRNLCPASFSTFISKGIEKILNQASDEKEKEKKMKNFINIFEAIVAFHKFHGGK